MANQHSFISKLGKASRNPSLIGRFLKNRLLQPYRLYIQRDEFTVAVKKWFRDRGDETLRLNYKLNTNSIVFDMGGYKGEYAESINRKFGCYVYVFEPVNRFYIECVKRFTGNEKVRCFNYGLSNSNGSFFISDEDNGSSLIKNNTSDSCEKVIVKRIDEEIENLKIKRIDLLKINVEGAEFLILPHILNNKNLIKNIGHIQIQFHTFYPNAKRLRDEIRTQLSETHNEEWNYPFVWESWTLKSKEASPAQP